MGRMIMNGEKINEILFMGIIGTEIVFGAFFFWLVVFYT